MDTVTKITQSQLNPNVVAFQVGDTVSFDYEVIEGKKKRYQKFDGLVIARKNKGISETFTVRKVIAGIGVERIIPVHSPKIKNFTVVKTGRARRAKLYYVRKLLGGCKFKERN